jgi:hypothetical protein
MMIRKKALYITIFIATMAGGAVLLALTSWNDLEKNDAQRPLVLSMTASVEVPESMTFAGEQITFDRYDKRERLDRELNSFTYFHSTTLLLIKRANRIFPVIEPILKQQGLPDDLKYLAVIESSLDPRAFSPSRAAGLWQFLQSTGKQYGLEVTAEVDERYHVEKSTLAAARYLRDAHRRFGTWSAAAMAYNGGLARISRELTNQGADEALDLWLVEETTRYYYRMLAIKLIFDNPQQYGFIIKPEQLYKPMNFKEVTVTTSIPDLAAFAREQGITYAQLKDFNSWLRSSKLTVTSGKQYILLIPTKEDLYYRKGEKPKVHHKWWVSQ